MVCCSEACKISFNQVPIPPLIISMGAYQDPSDFSPAAAQPAYSTTQDNGNSA